MKFTNKTIREIALETPATIPVFEKHNIDYCCGGNKKFSEACENAGISPETLSKNISVAITKAENTQEFNPAAKKSASELTDYLIEKHHTFTREEMERLTPLMAKVAVKHGDKHPELHKLKEVFGKLCEDLLPHLQKEEMVLFPFIKDLSIANERNTSLPTPHFMTVQNPIRMMGIEHDEAGDFLKEMRELSNDYSAPENACPSYKALYFGLEELEKDLHKHIHLENNLLFPKAVKLEQSVFDDDE